MFLRAFAFLRFVILFAVVAALLRSGVSPRGDRPRSWTDRGLRIFGACLIIAVLFFGMLFGLRGIW